MKFGDRSIMVEYNPFLRRGLSFHLASSTAPFYTIAMFSSAESHSAICSLASKDAKATEWVLYRFID